LCFRKLFWFLPSYIRQLTDGLLVPTSYASLNLRECGRNKVNNFSDQKLEEMLLNITSKEFKFIELIGGVLGFFIGIIQVIISGIGN
jgi:uncharacterized membrane protein YheB (UPF0754 family)